jgi:hypothetical protein
MKLKRIILLVFTIFSLLCFPVIAANNQNIPPEELDRQRKAKAKLEKTRQKAKPPTTTPAATPAAIPSYNRQIPVRYVPRSTNDYKDESGPAYEEAAPEPGIFVIESEPSGAEVWLKGRFLGKTPVTIADKAGSYPLVIKYSGFEETSIGALILSGKKSNVKILLDEQ